MPVLAEVAGAILSYTLDGSTRISSMSLDPTNATRAVRVRYPADGTKILVTVQPGGTVVTQTFTPAARLTRFTEMRTRPHDGAVIEQWSAPSWVLETVP